MIFLVLGLGAAGLAWGVESTLARLGWGWLGLTLAGWGGLSLAGPGRAWGKRPDGTFPAWHWAGCAPGHFVLAISMWIRRAAAGPVPAHEVIPRVWLGRRLMTDEARVAELLGIGAILDLTEEYAEPRALRRGRRYLNLPVPDFHAPTLEQVAAGVEFIREARRQGPVYVHCAAGRGRSALLVAAFLLAERRVETAGEAVEFLRRIRPEVLLVDGQRARLEEYAETLGGGRTEPPDRARFHPFGPPGRPGG